MITSELTPPLTARDKEFIAAIRAVVAEFGRNHIYEATSDPGGRSCDYVRDGRPSCLIAQALHRIGVTVEELAEEEGHPALWVMEAVGGFSRRVRVAASMAQSLQDARYPWGDALSRFEHVLGGPESVIDDYVARGGG